MEATAQMEQTEVKILRISTVVPAVQSCRQRMFLSNLDLFWLQISKPQRLLFYRVLPANEYSSIMDSLKKSLSLVLVHFYPFAGQLVIGEISGRPEIDCNDGGVEFVEASMDIPFNDLFRNPHSTLGQCSNQNTIQRWKYLTKLIKELTGRRSTSSCESTGEKIAALKERTGASTSFVAVASQFWRCVIKAREIAEEDPVYFGVPADCRGRVKPPLPLTYFGNCLTFCLAKTTAEKLVKEDVRFAASVIEELISVCTAGEQVNNMIEWVESGGRDVVDLLMEIGWKNSTSVSSSPRFPIYEIDYGWGTPLNVQAASMNPIGGMFVDGLKDGSIVVSTRLPPRQMETLTEILFLPTH